MKLGFLLRETFVMARTALVANRMRSLLALLGIVIGVATVIAMASLINGFQRFVQQNIQSMGNNTIYLRRIRPGVSFGPSEIPDSLKQRHAYTIGDRDAILAQSPSVKAMSVFMFPYEDVRLRYRERLTRSTFIYGTDDQLLVVRGFELANGRFFTDEEVRRNSNVVVLGRDTRQTLFDGGTGLGRTVYLNGIPFTVIGEFEKKGKFLGNNFDEVACIPYSVMQKYFGPPADAPPWFPKKGELFLDAIAVSPDRTEKAILEMTDVLRVRRHLPSNKPNDFVIMTDDVFLSLYNQLTGGIAALMFLISSISLFVGGIGVMNIMLVAVTERTREIGVRKALGAPRRAILLQFLVEAVLLTAGGGALGILMGAGVSGLVKMATPLPTYVSVSSVVLALAFSAVVGVFFGLYPAMRASRLDPVDSLRYE